MKFLGLESYNPRARVFWCANVLIGFGLLGVSLAETVLLPPQSILTLSAGIVIALLAGMYPVVIPNTKIAAVGGELVIFLIMLLFGTEAAVVAAAAEATVGSFRASKKWTSRIGSPAMASLSMWLCASAFQLALAPFGGIEHAYLPVFFVVLASFAVLYAATSSFLFSTLIALTRDVSLNPIQWVKDYWWLAVVYAASALISGLLYITARSLGMTVVFVGVPIIGMLLSTLYFFFRSRETTREADLTAKHLAEIRQSEERFHSAFTHSALGMALVSTDLIVVQVNKSFSDMVGFDNDAITGGEIAQYVIAEDRERLVADLTSMVDDDSTVDIEHVWVHRDGSPVSVNAHVAFFLDWASGSRCLIFQMQDVTARRAAEERLRHVAYHDDLTDLPNRVYFNELLRQAISDVEDDIIKQFAVMYLDFDRFKVINDSLGHKAGDLLLMTMAGRLGRCLKEGDILARLGGDEFAVLVQDVDSDSELISIADQLLGCFVSPVRLGETEVTVSASIGIAVSGPGYVEAEGIMRDADTAMYRAKSLGRSRYVMFDTALHDQVVEQLTLEQEIRRALPQRELVLNYQPIYALGRSVITGFESLVRWQSPKRGLVGPAAFIPLAEETGLIIDIGNWVMNHACHQLRTWVRNGDCDDTLVININVSAVQLARPDFVSIVAQTIRRHEIRPEQITLEFTESVLMDGENVILTMRQLSDLGVKLSIDDFGTGYSSLSYLHALPIDVLKIDRAFVSRLSNTSNGQSIVRSIISLGKALSKTLVAEGIEEEGQLSQLVAMGCDEGQGYLFSKPVDAESARALLRANATHQKPALVVAN
jgi:diguanylate cyclase (GGDEF)-like protein/PAS domain S-box-containing protein